MKIDVSDGSVTFASGMIGPRMDRMAFLNSPIGAAAKNVMENAGYVHLHFDPEPGLHANAMFKDDRLDRLFLLMAIPSDHANEWTEAREVERKVIHDKWLRQELGKPPYEYAWGHVVSEYDAKGCESEIILVYGRRQRAQGHPRR
jgi:hypothetical protein